MDGGRSKVEIFLSIHYITLIFPSDPLTSAALYLPFPFTKSFSLAVPLSFHLLSPHRSEDAHSKYNAIKWVFSTRFANAIHPYHLFMLATPTLAPRRRA